MRVTVSSELPIGADVMKGLLVKPAVMRHVLWPLITLPHVADRRLELGDSLTIRLRTAGIVPLWSHTIRVVDADEAAGYAQTEEHGGPVRSWRHRLTVEELTPTSCRYTDDVEIDAGPATWLTTYLARWIYRYRHRRWAALAEVLA